MLDVPACPNCPHHAPTLTATASDSPLVALTCPACALRAPGARTPEAAARAWREMVGALTAAKEAYGILEETHQFFGDASEDRWEWADGTRCRIGQRTRGWLRRWNRVLTRTEVPHVERSHPTP